MAVVFFSYSHVDEELRDRLEVSLAMLQNQGLIEAWHDRRITAGSELDPSINEHLERANLILLLVSPDFLASRYCYDVEMRRALERHQLGEATIIPVILRPCDWRASPFSKLLAAPKDGKPITKWADIDEAFQNVVDMIRGALPKANQMHRTFAPSPSGTRTQANQLPRSSNLRLAKKFTEADCDRFLDDAFEFIANFFEGSLEEVKARNSNIDTAFKRLDAGHFTAVIYRNGTAAARCKISSRHKFGNGITYNHDDRAAEGTMNEALYVSASDQGLFLKPLGMAHIGRSGEQHLTLEGAAEYFWAMLIKPLQS